MFPNGSNSLWHTFQRNVFFVASTIRRSISEVSSNSSSTGLGCTIGCFWVLVWFAWGVRLFESSFGVVFFVGAFDTISTPISLSKEIERLANFLFRATICLAESEQRARCRGNR